MNSARASLKIFLSRSSGAALSFFGFIYFARELGPQQIGIFFLFQAVLGIVAIPTDFGISNAVNKRISEGFSPSTILSTAVLLKLTLIIILSTVIFLFKNSLNQYLGAELAIYLVVALIFQEFSKLAIETLEGELRVGATALPTIARPVVLVVISSILVLLGWGINGLIYGLLAALAAKFFISALRINTPLGRPTHSAGKKLIDYSKYAFITSVGAYAYSWIDVTVIGFFLSQSQVGIYEIAWRITVAAMLFSHAIATGIFPQISQWKADDVIENIEALLPNAIATSTFFVIPAFFGVVALSREILIVIFGAEYGVGWVVLIILMGEKVLQSVHVIIGGALHGLDRPNLAAKAAIISILFNFLLNIVFVPLYGIEGAAAATTLSFTLNTILHGYYLNQFIDIQIPYAELGGVTAASGGMFVVVVGMNTLIEEVGPLELIGMITLGALGYSAIALMIQPVRLMIVKNIREVVA